MTEKVRMPWVCTCGQRNIVDGLPCLACDRMAEEDKTTARKFNFTSGTRFREDEPEELDDVVEFSLPTSMLRGGSRFRDEDIEEEEEVLDEEPVEVEPVDDELIEDEEVPSFRVDEAVAETTTEVEEDPVVEDEVVVPAAAPQDDVVAEVPVVPSINGVPVAKFEPEPEPAEAEVIDHDAFAASFYDFAAAVEPLVPTAFDDTEVDAEPTTTVVEEEPAVVESLPQDDAVEPAEFVHDGDDPWSLWSPSDEEAEANDAAEAERRETERRQSGRREDDRSMLIDEYNQTERRDPWADLRGIYAEPEDFFAPEGAAPVEPETEEVKEFETNFFEPAEPFVPETASEFEWQTEGFEPPVVEEEPAEAPNVEEEIAPVVDALPTDWFSQFDQPVVEEPVDDFAAAFPSPWSTPVTPVEEESVAEVAEPEEDDFSSWFTASFGEPEIEEPAEETVAAEPVAALPEVEATEPVAEEDWDDSEYDGWALDANGEWVEVSASDAATQPAVAEWDDVEETDVEPARVDFAASLSNLSPAAEAAVAAVDESPWWLEGTKLGQVDSDALTGNFDTSDYFANEEYDQNANPWTRPAEPSDVHGDDLFSDDVDLDEPDEFEIDEDEWALVDEYPATRNGQRRDVRERSTDQSGHPTRGGKGPKRANSKPAKNKPAKKKSSQSGGFLGSKLLTFGGGAIVAIVLALMCYTAFQKAFAAPNPNAAPIATTCSTESASSFKSAGSLATALTTTPAGFTAVSDGLSGTGPVDFSAALAAEPEQATALAALDQTRFENGYSRSFTNSGITANVTVYQFAGVSCAADYVAFHADDKVKQGFDATSVEPTATGQMTDGGSNYDYVIRAAKGNRVEIVTWSGDSSPAHAVSGALSVATAQLSSLSA